MGDSFKAIAEDIDEYLENCIHFGELAVLESGHQEDPYLLINDYSTFRSVAVYGPHAKELLRRKEEQVNSAKPEDRDPIWDL